MRSEIKTDKRTVVVVGIVQHSFIRQDFGFICDVCLFLLCLYASVSVSESVRSFALLFVVSSVVCK